MSEALRRENSPRDHYGRCQLIVETAAERFDLVAADGPAAPNWYDLVIAQDGHDTIGLATPVKARGATARIESDRNRKGRWKLRRPTHDRLLAADGFYALGVYEGTEIQHLALVPAADVAVLAEGSWVETDDCEVAQVSWGKVFDAVDPGRGTIADGSGEIQAVAEIKESRSPVDPTPQSSESAPIELVVDPVNSDTALTLAVTRHLRQEFDVELSIRREHVLVYEIGGEQRGRWR